MTARARIEVDGRVLDVTNLDKVMYPKDGTTKGDVLRYYAEVAGLMLPYVKDRPATRKRWVEGVDHEPFFHKALEPHAPPWLRRCVVLHRGARVPYPVLDDAASLMWAAQQAALEIHVPQWRCTRTPRTPQDHLVDRVVFDLDPGPGVDLSECAALALRVREALEELADHIERTEPVTSGSKGIHVYAHLRRPLLAREGHEFARRLAEEFTRRDPSLVVSDMAKSARDGRILIDWSQNHGAKTTIAPFSLRGREAPTVAAPRTWAELESPDLAQLHMRELLARLGRSATP